MDVKGGNYNNTAQSSEDEEKMELKRGPWTVNEDLLLINYIAKHGEGRWNHLAISAGLNRTGKSCRLRWLNYLRPNVRRGNLTLEEQLTILELHSRWGNRWSKIAENLPGRTDNEIKNYWRTRVLKHAKQLGCDVNSKLFKDTMRYIWIPRLVERINAGSERHPSTTTTAAANNELHACNSNKSLAVGHASSTSFACKSSSTDTNVSPDYCALQSNTDVSFGTTIAQINYEESMSSPCGDLNHDLKFQSVEQNNVWLDSDDLWWNMWNVEDLLF